MTQFISAHIFTHSSNESRREKPQAQTFKDLLHSNSKQETIIDIFAFR